MILVPPCGSILMNAAHETGRDRDTALRRPNSLKFGRSREDISIA